jgi:hypothetical protein
MAGDPSDVTAEKPSKAPSPATPGERARTAADTAVGAMKGKMTRWQDAASSDHQVPSHTPDASEGGTADEKAREKHPSDMPVTFGQRLKELRQSLPDVGTLEKAIEKGMEPDCP